VSGGTPAGLRDYACMIRLLALTGLVLLAGCASSREPLIDHMGVSDAKYNSDLSECRGTGGWFSFGSPVADCMKGKGYKVLMGDSGL
jgi:hypothetical protein